MMEATAEARPRRRTLSEELDRLDGIIDALAEGLREAVADAAREGVREVVREVAREAIAQALAEADLRRAVPQSRQAPGRHDPRAHERGLRTRLAAAARALLAGAVRRLATACGRVTARCRRMRSAVEAMETRMGVPLPARRVAVLSLGAGLAAALGLLPAPDWASVLSGGLGAACVVAVAQLAAWLSCAPARATDANDSGQHH